MNFANGPCILGINIYTIKKNTNALLQATRWGLSTSKHRQTKGMVLTTKMHGKFIIYLSTYRNQHISLQSALMSDSFSKSSMKGQLYKQTDRLPWAHHCHLWLLASSWKTLRKRNSNELTSSLCVGSSMSTHVVWLHGPEKIDGFLNLLNSRHTNIQFTMETESDCHFPFLDTNIAKDQMVTLVTLYTRSKPILSSIWMPNCTTIWQISTPCLPCQKSQSHLQPGESTQKLDFMRRTFKLNGYNDRHCTL